MTEKNRLADKKPPPLSPLPPPRKRFGQHFLTDVAVLDRIVAAFAPARGQRILEIGAGRGALTEALLRALPATDSDSTARVENAARVAVVELDRELAHRLQQRYSRAQVRVISGDALRLTLADLNAAADSNSNSNPDSLQQHAGGGQNRAASSCVRWRVLGNLPYNISTPLIFHLLRQLDAIQDMLFMLQQEVAQRLAAAPGGRQYGRLSVMAALAVDCELLFAVPPHAFHPPPQVQSTVLRLTPKKHPLQPRNPKIFQAVLAAAFCQRRKTLRNALAEWAQAEHFRAADINPQLRAETLSVHQYIALADAIC